MIGLQTMPVLAALLLAALGKHQDANDPDWLDFLAHFIAICFVGLPMIAAHLAAARLPPLASFVLWLASFVLYPIAANMLLDGYFILGMRDCLILGAFSALALLTSSDLNLRRSQANALSVLYRAPITLDGAVVFLLAAWALTASSLFTSTADAVNNQPLRIWFDAERIAQNPAEFATYLLQFTAIAALLFGFYWGCRYILIRKVLRQHGWVVFAQASLALWILYPPIACSLILLLPMNLSGWSLLPSENNNAFDPTNYVFAFILWATVNPIVLASERLLAERSDAVGRHEHVRAELYILQQQINPHFLFNSLNTVYALCLKDRASSADAIVKLSDLLRYAVYDGQKECAALDEEIVYLNNYIDLQLLRFGERCHVSCTWPDSAEQYKIPPLLLIMLVENAFKHGVEPFDQLAEVKIELSIIGSRMCFTCVNSLLLAPEQSRTQGLGLTNLRRRLELLFGTSFSLTSTGEDASWRASLELELIPC